MEKFSEAMTKSTEKDISILNSMLALVTIEYKWKAYARSEMVRRFLFAIAFFTLFVLDIHYWKEYNNRIFFAFTVLFFIYVSREEALQLSLVKAHSYFGDFWNCSQAILLLLYTLYFWAHIFEYEPGSGVVVGLQIFLVLFFAIYFNYYMRMYENFGFLVNMIVEMFYEMLFFLLYYFMLMSFIGLQISLVLTDQEYYNKTGTLQWFLIAIGQDLSSFLDKTEFIFLFWFVWLLQFIIGTVVLMNVVIAVVNDVFSKCSAQSQAKKLKVRLEMIHEIDQCAEYVYYKKCVKPCAPDCILRKFWPTTREFKLRQFPMYVLIRRPVDESLTGEEFIWKDTFEDNITKLSRELEKKMQGIEDKQEKNHHQVIKALKKLIHRE